MTLIYLDGFKFKKIFQLNETFEKSYLLIGLSKFAQTFAGRFLKSSSIHPICINVWGSFSFNVHLMRWRS